MTIKELIEYGPELEELKNKLFYPLDRLRIPQNKVELILSAIRELKAKEPTQDLLKTPATDEEHQDILELRGGF